MSHPVQPLFAAPCVALLLLAFSPTPARAAEPMPSTASAETVRWFQTTEQALMDAVGKGDKTVWDRVMDPSFIATSEEGEVITGKSRFLEELRPLPPGLAGGITVKELTVAEYPGFAIVRYLADEWETVFGQRLTTKYRTTDTFRRDGSSWKMVGSHTSVVTQDPSAQPVSTASWPKLAGSYRILPDGWTFHVELKDGKLYGGRDPKTLKPLVPLAPDAFVLSGSLGDLIFVSNPSGKVTHILELRKFEPLVWTRVDATPTPP
jgi:hypothetical protein